MKQVLIGARVKPVLELEGVRFRDLNGNGVLDPYEDRRLSAAERAADLVSRMTPEEKIGLMVINSRTMGISQPDREFASHAGTLDEQCHRI
jgi:beta-glucosidase